MIAAGTGLGEAGLYWDGQKATIFSPAKAVTRILRPRTELEIEFCVT